MASNKQIVTALREYFETRDKLKECRVNLVRIAVECGQSQQDAAKSNVAEYLDGYLAGAGVLPVGRTQAS